MHSENLDIDLRDREQSRFKLDHNANELIFG